MVANEPLPRSENWKFPEPSSSSSKFGLELQTLDSGANFFDYSLLDPPGSVFVDCMWGSRTGDWKSPNLSPPSSFTIRGSGARVIKFMNGV